MARPRSFQQLPITLADRHAMRLLCARALEAARGRTAPLLPLIESVSPVEAVIAYHIIYDFAYGTGHEHSTAALVLTRKAYYLRKRHFFYALKTWHPEWLADPARYVAEGVV